MEVDCGVHEAGYHRFRLIGKEGRGGSFLILPGKTQQEREGPCVIKIGLDYERVQDIYEVLHHEIQEYVATMMNLRYELSDMTNYGHDRYFFWMNHQQYSELICSVSEGLVFAWPPLDEAWKKFRAKMDKPPKKARKK